MVSREAGVWFVCATLFAFAAACQTDSGARPAVLADPQPGALDEVRRAASVLVGRARVELGAGDLQRQSVVGVLPPPLGPHETHSLARPDQLNIVLMGSGCYLVHPETGQAEGLAGVDCRALNEAP